MRLPSAQRECHESAAYRTTPYPPRHPAQQQHLSAAQFFHAGGLVLCLLRHHPVHARPIPNRRHRRFHRHAARRHGRPRGPLDQQPKRVRRTARQPGRYGEFRRGPRPDRLQLATERIRPHRLFGGFRLLRLCRAAPGPVQHPHRQSGQKMVYRHPQPDRRGFGDRPGVGGPQLRPPARRAMAVPAGDPVCRFVDGGADQVLEFQRNQCPPQSAVFCDDSGRGGAFGGGFGAFTGVVPAVLGLQPVRLCDVAAGMAGQTAGYLKPAPSPAQSGSGRFVYGRAIAGPR